MKNFDYALDCGSNETEVYFTNGSRYDMPTDVYRAIVRAGANGLVKSIITTADVQNRC